MMKFSNLAAAVGAGLLWLSGVQAAQAEVVTFDDPVGVANAFLATTPLTDQGLVFAYDSGLGYVWPGGQFIFQSNGTNNYIYAYGKGLTITRQGGGVFNLDSLDLSLSWYTVAGGGVDDPPATLFSDTVTLDADTLGGPVSIPLTATQGFNTYVLGLTDVVSLHLSPMSTNTGYWAIDNLVGSNFGVPEPSSWALMLLGVAATGAMLRTRRRPLAA